MRPRNLVAGTALTAALALVALPGFVDSRVPSRDQPIDAAAFQQINTASDGGSSLTIDLPDDALRSAGALTVDSRLFEPGKGTRIPITKPRLQRADVGGRLRHQAAEVQAQRHGHVLRQRHDRDAAAARER